MRALVLGGSGHIGNAFVRALASRDYEVYATGQSDRNPYNLRGVKSSYISMSDRDDDFERRLDGYNVIVDAAAPYPLYARDFDAAHAQRRCASILRAVKTSGARLIYVSSFTTLTDLPQSITESARLLHPYFDLKRSLESRILDSCLDTIVINPTQCIGPWDMKPLKFALIPLLLRGDVLMTSGHPINVVDVRDVADSALIACETQRFNEPILCTGHNTTVETLFNRIAEIGGTKPPTRRGMSELAAVMSYSFEMISPLLPPRMRYPSLGMLLLSCQQWVFPGANQRSLGAGRHSLTRSLIDSVSWYRERPDLSDEL